MKANESSQTKEEGKQCLNLCSRATAFGEASTNGGLMKIEIKTETNLSDEDVEIDLDVESDDDMCDNISGLSPSKSENLNQDSVMKTVTNESVECHEVDVDTGANDSMYDHTSSQAETLTQTTCSIKASSPGLLQTGTLDKRTGKEVTGCAKESSAVDIDIWQDQVLDDSEDEDDPYNRFYFESDHLALKDNKQ